MVPSVPIARAWKPLLVVSFSNSRQSDAECRLETSAHGRTTRPKKVTKRRSSWTKVKTDNTGRNREVLAKAISERPSYQPTDSLARAIGDAADALLEDARMDRMRACLRCELDGSA
ncbi:hypothetical protein HN011_003541 [Eciton burchellii]|nr:hypothetical protein HN011_003541 [Eciton burchellii]